MNRATKLLNLVEMFSPADADSVVEKLKSGIKAPFVNAYKSTLGGIEHTSILITVSLDPEESWTNGILQNSRYFQMHYSTNGVLEMFSRGRGLSGKFRKTKVKDVYDALVKINKFIDMQNELRISKGIARWTANFLPPTEEYSAVPIGGIDSSAKGEEK